MPPKQGSEGQCDVVNFVAQDVVLKPRDGSIKTNSEGLVFCPKPSPEVLGSRNLQIGDAVLCGQSSSHVQILSLLEKDS